MQSGQFVVILVYLLDPDPKLQRMVGSNDPAQIIRQTVDGAARIRRVLAAGQIGEIGHAHVRNPVGQDFEAGNYVGKINSVKRLSPFFDTVGREDIQPHNVVRRRDSQIIHFGRG